MVDLMVSELGFLYSSKVLVLDNFSNTPSHALPPATRKPLHKTPSGPFHQSSKEQEEMGTALVQALRGHEGQGLWKSDQALCS